MKIEATAIDGQLLIKPNFYIDERGWFYESWQIKRYINIDNFAQDNISMSKKNVLRGMHYQINDPQGQLVWVSHGKILDVTIDLRPTSPTFLTVVKIELNSDEPYQLYMPPGVAHGFYVFSDLALVNYKCSKIYDSADEGGLLWSDLEIEWPCSSPFVSERDSNFPRLKQINPDKLPTNYE